eukprot:10460411-Prorocentrum_lima.AAC.1
MGSSRVDIHTVSYRASISACEKGAQWAMAMNLLVEEGYWRWVERGLLGGRGQWVLSVEDGGVRAGQ